MALSYFFILTLFCGTHHYQCYVNIPAVGNVTVIMYGQLEKSSLFLVIKTIETTTG